MFRFILDIISPKICYSCKKEWSFICEDCFSKIYDFEEKCYVCKKYSKNSENHRNCQVLNNVFYDKIIILKHYKNPLIKKLIKDWKFYNKKEILEELSFFLFKKFLESESVEKFDEYLVISIPSYFLRKWKRWYNSSEVLAKSFARYSNINYKKNTLKKVRNTKQQSKLDRKTRLDNLKNSFTFDEKYLNLVKDKKVIIVDDVVSTWATINEISSILKQKWAKKIIWLVVASD